MKSVYSLIVASLFVIALGLWWMSTQPLPEPEIAQPEEPASPVRGSFEWCEQMLALPGDQWTDPDTRTFAEHCLLE